MDILDNLTVEKTLRMAQELGIHMMDGMEKNMHYSKKPLNLENILV